MKTAVLVLALAASVGCRSTPIKQTSTLTLRGSALALHDSFYALRSLCSPTTPVGVKVAACDGPNAAGVGLTVARFDAISSQYAVAFATEVKAGEALQAWKSGDPKPQSIQDYSNELSATQTVVGVIIPQTQPAITKLQQALAEVAGVLNLIGAR